MPLKAILDRLQVMERLMPSMVTVTYPDDTQTAVEALKAFEIAVHNREVTFSVPGNIAMETLLRDVADAVADDEYRELKKMDKWKFDEHGKPYRETAPGHREYEMTITLSGGVEIPVSELDEYHRRQKEAEEKRRQATLAEMKNRPAPRSCPFMDGCNNTCRREKCRIFLDGRCSIAVIADATGAEIEEAPARDKKCPFSIYGHCESCALYSKGCAVARIATATNK